MKPDKSLFSATPASMRYVACIEEEERRIQQCPYRTSSGQIYFVERYRIMWSVLVYDVLSGDKVGEEQLFGVDPAACTQTERFSIGQYVKKYYGDKPNDKLNEWLASLVE